MHPTGTRTRTFRATKKGRATGIAPVAISVLALVWSARARADESSSAANTPSAANAPNTANAANAPSTRQLLDEEARELKLRIEVERLRGQLVRTRHEVAAIAPDGSAGPGDRDGPRSPERATALLPDLFGVTAMTSVGAIGGTLVGIGAGPLAYGTTHDARADATSWSFAPSGDLVVGRRFTIGASVAISRLTARSSDDGFTNESHTIAVGPRVGLLVPLGGGLTFWPAFGVVGGVVRSELGVPAATTRVVSRFVTPSASASIVMPITRHLFAAVGADLAMNVAVAEGVASDAQSVRLGSHLRLGLAL